MNEKGHSSIQEHKGQDNGPQIYRFTRAEVYAAITLCLAGLSYSRSSSDAWKKDISELRAEFRETIRDLRKDLQSEIDRIGVGK